MKFKYLLLSALSLQLFTVNADSNLTQSSNSNINGYSETGNAFPPVPFPVKPLVEEKANRYDQFSGSFTDSQGRTSLYQYAVPKGMDTSVPQPVVMYLHGNNAGSQQDLLDNFFWFLRDKVISRNMIFVMPVSPETKQFSDGPHRHWNYVKDITLIHEFINERLSTHFIVDKRQFYFAGASQGTCFINQFLPNKGEGYAGGFFAGCGCHNYRDSAWSPSKDLTDNLKIYVSSTTGDFLLDTSTWGADYYESEGFDVRRDLTQAGGHCSIVWEQMNTALDWFMTFPRVPAPSETNKVFLDSFE